MTTMQESCSSSKGHAPINEDFDPSVYAKAQELYKLPFLQLIQIATKIHAENWPNNDIQRSTLLSIKTGNCPEDCSYCPQSARYSTDINKHDLLDLDAIVQSAKEAKEQGSTRFCMGAAWRKPPRGPQFEKVLKAITEVKELGLETCATLGMLDENQSQQLKNAGLDYYNHNVDSSKEFYGEIISTRSFSDRVKTLNNLRDAGINVCCGGIFGMGELPKDRLKMLSFLASMNPHPESVPLNILVKVEGTPLEKQDNFDTLEFVRQIAVARILMPKTRVRLSAGRYLLSREAQAMCFIAGANSIHAGEKLLTTPLPGVDFDTQLINDLTKPLGENESPSNPA